MAEQKGQEIRNQADKKNNSAEQNQKLEKGQDIEPQAEKWSTDKADNGKRSD